MFVNTRCWTIEWGDCDPAGIVFYPRYFAAFDTSTACLLEAATGMKSARIIHENGIIGWPMVDTSARFMAPASYGDFVEIETRMTRVGRSSFALEHQLTKDGQVCIEASEVRVWAAPRTDGAPGIMGVPIPEPIAARLRAE
ncbi:4-hydroxybenzoyl-CoA thioesterase [Novosphingobium endophyticum]|uniref:4-hydroxybenzoyl-CoA thioesterase n=1 Tax=Novosphingobium endophyticum TaxID=1955250 RepID=A0A916X3U8_9SPHN|nr:thioesterase family protein [Novosphingobium endophyticum]GGB94717.1 4-hydroxybenzoyl-CoA thioesterase [Novosphingobium endophyticum]